MSQFNPEEIPAILSKWMNNFMTNTRSSFARLSAKDWIRLIAIVGAYLLIIRPLLVKLGVKIQKDQHERDATDTSGAGTIDPRTGMPRKMQIPGVESDSDEDEDGTKADPKTGEWGRKARLRQRRFVRKAMEQKEGHLLADDDDDIKEFLEE